MIAEQARNNWPQPRDNWPQPRDPSARRLRNRLIVANAAAWIVIIALILMIFF